MKPNCCTKRNSQPDLHHKPKSTPAHNVITFVITLTAIIIY